MKLVPILVLFLFQLSHSCSVPSFREVSVRVAEKNSYRFRIISGCITPQTLKFRKGQLVDVRITGQDIIELKEGAVSDIQETFGIHFYKNNISTIRCEAFRNLPQLDTIELDRNEINWIESNVFENLSFLDTVSLKENKLEMLLDNTFVNLPNLTTVSLEDNLLEIFQQHWFHNTPKLVYLLLDNNFIKSIPRAAFITLPSLECISLFNNHIMYIHKNAFLNLENLTELDLSKNKLTTIDFNFKTVPNLRLLEITQNSLNYISDATLKDMQMSLKGIWIFFNPWQCSCLDKFLKWGENFNVKVAWQCKNTDLSCIAPKNYERSCVELPPEVLRSYNYSKSFSGKCDKKIKF